MPIISKFYGIIIRMYYLQSEHNPPHIHAIYNNDIAVVDINSCEIIRGKLPNKAMALVIEWVSLHKEELLKIWETQVFEMISPLE